MLYYHVHIRTQLPFGLPSVDSLVRHFHVDGRRGVKTSLCRVHGLFIRTSCHHAINQVLHRIHRNDTNTYMDVDMMYYVNTDNIKHKAKTMYTAIETEPGSDVMRSVLKAGTAIQYNPVNILALQHPLYFNVLLKFSCSIKETRQHSVQHENPR